MDNKADINIRIILIFILVVLFFIGFVFAAHVIRTSSGGTSYNINEDVGFIYNISVNNSDAGQNANITQVNITLPSGFLFVPGASNGTTVQNYSFVNTSSVLSWTNSTYFLINGSDGSVLNYFWFNATASTPGNYNITVTTLNATGAFYSNISMTVNDTTVPSSIEFASPVETDGTNLSRSNIRVNVSATDNGVIDRITIRLYNSTQDLINTSLSSTGVASYFINFTSLADGTYRFNATVNDTYNNVNNTATRLVILDTTPPLVSSINSPVAGANVTGVIVLNATVTDTSTAVNSVYFNVTNSTGTQQSFITSNNAAGNNWNATLNASTLTDGSHNITVFANDSVGNLNNTQRVQINVDNTKPVPLFGTGTENSGVNVSRNWVYVNVSVTETNERNITFSIFNSTSTVNSTTYTTTQRTINWTGLSDGVYTYNVTVYDYAGNSNTTETRTITLDTTNPLVSYGTNAENDGTNISRTNVYVNVTVTETNEANITFLLFNSTSQYNSTTFTTAVRTINWTGLADGTYTFNVTVRDYANNANTTATRTVKVDTAVPSSIQFVSPTETAGASLSRNYILINITATDSVALANITIRLYNSSNSQIQINTSTSSPFFINYSALSDGIYYFNATATDYVNQQNSTSTRNVTLDITSPSSISFVAPTNTSGSNLSLNYIRYNVTASDAINISSIVVRLFNSSRAQINSSTSTASPLSGNFSGLSDGTYYINATVNDTAGNSNSTATRTIVLDTTAPSASISCTPNPVKSGTTLTCTCSSSDATSGVQATSYTANPSTSNTGTHTTSCTATDYAGNSGSGSFSYTVELLGGGGSGGGGGGGSSTGETIWKTTIPYGSLTEKGPATKSLAEDQRISIKVEGDSGNHYVGILDITKTTAKIQVSSTPQEATLNIGETKKFDITSDNKDYYNLAIILNSITNNKANITIKSINEQIPAPQPEPAPVPQEETQQQEEQPAQPVEQTQLSPPNKSKVKTIILTSIIILLLGIVIFIIVKSKKLKISKYN